MQAASAPRRCTWNGAPAPRRQERPKGSLVSALSGLPDIEDNEPGPCGAAIETDSSDSSMTWEIDRDSGREMLSFHVPD